MNPTAPNPGQPGWRSWLAACGTIAATYFYFLIFAEFAFLELATAAMAAPDRLRPLMLVLGSGGIFGALFGAARFRSERAPQQLAWTLRACAVGAVVAWFAHGAFLLFLAAALTGVSLGWLTVALASSLQSAAGPTRLGWCVGLGTGLAYALCNVPVIFRAAPSTQTLLAASAAALASFLPRWLSAATQPAVSDAEYSGLPALRWVLVLLALVWLDSAAFYVVQHSTQLRAITWQGDATLWANAGVHLLAAVGAGALLDCQRRGTVSTVAMISLGLAGLILSGVLPGDAVAVWCYTAGVSLYSTVLVEYPARSGRPFLAALVFAVAGWLGSAFGIGMAQDLHRIPVAFVVAAVAVVATALTWRRYTLRLGAIAALVLTALPAVRADQPEPLVTLGREVYIAEGCIHCHSQYIRPRLAADVALWGPARPLAEAKADQPPLFGTRRQGPDLSQVGSRRTPEWNRLHLMHPQAVSPGSRMPSYAHLFTAGDDRGDALVAYLESLGGDAVAERRQQIAAWQPDTRQVLPPDEAGKLFARLCVQCHGPQGQGDGPLAHQLSVRPPNWTTDPWRHPAHDAPLETVVSRIIKFGVPGLPMAGHEYLPDGDVVGLARYVISLHR
ncbi:cbb3-type cytochrome c oxidase subunit II [Opitutus terrae]|uniref:Cytochrome C oxidase mono-heme subunit/FixO n=1 Tax=Opitutus terrae (strain DSM 11246 / JCM 15787 / PB90-1) TaxID=452637 RepID=B1ZSK7_OPITP|nr:cbb3-type cytochrome c oxidase subunit II [Opitutus terrae]ACB73864.1 cytochrome C oxidase mono-heme subunit/FixO [Opitutus terrae PB90-1]